MFLLKENEIIENFYLVKKGEIELTQNSKKTINITRQKEYTSLSEERFDINKPIENRLVTLSQGNLLGAEALFEKNKLSQYNAIVKSAKASLY